MTDKSQPPTIKQSPDNGELKACPFCGGGVQWGDFASQKDSVNCISCVACEVIFEFAFHSARNKVAGYLDCFNIRHPNIEAVVKRTVELAREKLPLFPGIEDACNKSPRIETYLPETILSIINKEFGV